MTIKKACFSLQKGMYYLHKYLQSFFPCHLSCAFVTRQGTIGLHATTRFPKAMQKWKPLRNFKRIPNTVMILFIIQFHLLPLQGVPSLA